MSNEFESRIYPPLRRHWAISPSTGSQEIKGFITKNIGADFLLHHHPDLHVSSRSYTDGIIIILGAFVHCDYESTRELNYIKSPTQNDIIPWLIGCAGSYVLISSHKDIVSLYTDMGGIFSVYKKGKFCASTPYLLPDIKEDQSLRAEYALKDSDDWYPGDLTPFEGVSALYGSHCLNLSENTLTRYWPNPLPPPEKISRKEAISQISKIHRKNIELFAEKYSCAMSITAGKDSRLNLAAARNVTDKIYFFTIRQGKKNTYDILAPTKMADTFSLNHHIIESTQPKKETIQKYDESSGKMSIGARRDIIDACEIVASKAEVHLSGALGEYLRGQYWPSVNPTKVSTKSLESEFTQKTPIIKKSIQDWIDTLPKGIPPTTAYDLMYIEQRGGRWAGNGETASAIFFAPGTPLNCRKIFEIVQCMPRKLDRNGELHIELIKNLWPELLDIPFEKNHRNIGILLPKALRAKIKKIKNMLR